MYGRSATYPAGAAIRLALARLEHTARLVEGHAAGRRRRRMKTFHSLINPLLPRTGVQTAGAPLPAAGFTEAGVAAGSLPRVFRGNPATRTAPSPADPVGEAMATLDRHAQGLDPNLHLAFWKQAASWPRHSRRRSEENIGRGVLCARSPRTSAKKNLIRLKLQI